jgi:uncharacterized protein with PhoU and TrkA domain
MTLEERAMRAQARMDARRAARAAPEAVAARKEKARVARLAAKARKATAAANAAAGAAVVAVRRAPRARAPRVDPGTAQRQADADFLRGERELADMLAEMRRERAAQPQRFEFTMDDIMRRARR